MRVDRPLWLRFLASVYRACLRSTPRPFRHRFGPEAEDAFRDLVADTLANDGSGAAVTTAAAACGDVVRTGIADRVTAWNWKRSAVTGFGTDVRQALRIYRRESILAAALAITLALVSGPALAIFAVLYDVVLSPLPYPKADRLVAIHHRTPRGISQWLPAYSVHDYRDVQGFSAVGGIFPLGSTVVQNGEPRRVSSFRTTAGLLTLLDVPFVAGRDLARGASEAVITRGFALARFGGEISAVGQTLVVNRAALTVVGVLAYPPPLPGSAGVELFIPHTTADADRPSRSGGQAIVIAKLSDGVSPAVAGEQAKAVAARAGRDTGDPAVPVLLPLRAAVSGALRIPLLTLFAVVGMVVLVAVTSLASLILARAASRASDIAIRVSLGASRARLVRAWLVEGIALALPGMAMAVWLAGVILRYARTTLPPRIVPWPESIALPVILGASLALAAVTVVLFACAPLVAGVLKSPSVALREATRNLAGLRRVRSQSLLVIGQVAISLVLVVSAIWLSTSVRRTLSRSVGFDTSRLVITQVHAVRSWTPDHVRQALARLGQLDPAARVTVASGMPGVNASSYGPLRIRPGDPVFTDRDRPTLARSAVAAGYFETLGIPMIEGRTFTPDDEQTPTSTIIVSRSFAARWFPQGALGRFVSFTSGDRRLVIGVAEDVHAGRLIQDSEPQFYVPMTDVSMGVPTTYILRTDRSAAALRADIDGIMRGIDASASATVLSAGEAMALPLTLQRITNRLVSSMGLVVLLLAVVNVYALSAFSVLRRTREIGIRVALGAAPAEATRLVMRRGVTWVGIGLALGGGLTVFLAAPLMRGQLYETSTADPRLVALAIAVVGGASLVASWLPARRAARIDPAVALRAE
jgi:putative ABC transport system permease protein